MSNIIKVEKAMLATMPVDQLIRKVDSMVKSAFTKTEDACAAYDAAVEQRKEYKGEDKAEIKRLDDNIREMKIARNEHIQDIEEYIQEQMELFRSRRLDPQRAYKEAIIPTGQLTTTGVEMCRIVKRKFTLEECEEDKGDGVNLSVKACHSYSDTLGMQREQKRGKYNDAHLLIEQSTMSIDKSEVTPFCQACL